MSNEKFCTKCGRKFIAVGREVICPACKESAKEEAQKAAVLRAKRASWSGESVPVRISGRASTVIRKWAARRGLTFAESLDSILQLTESISCFKEMWEEEKWNEWQDIEPYRSRRLKKSSTDGEQDKQEKATTSPSAPSKPVVQAAKATGKAGTKKTTSKASKAVKTTKKEIKA